MGNWIYELISLSTSEGKQKFVSRLENASYLLFAVENSGSLGVEASHKIRQARGALNKTIEILSLPDTAINNFEAGLQIVDALNGLGGNIADDPVKAAKAFGKLFGGLGKLAAYLPPPVRYYVQLFEGCEEFFSNMQIKIVPHMRPSNRRVADQVLKSDGIDIWAPL